MDFGDVIVGQQALDRISGLYHWLAKSITSDFGKLRPIIHDRIVDFGIPK